MNISKQASKLARQVVVIVSVILLIFGAYLLANTLSPLLMTPAINPQNNSTTKLITSTEDKITENRLYIPKIDINLPYSTGDETVMEDGAWWRAPDSGNPKDGGNFVLSAHRFVMGLTPQQTLRKSPFYNINKLVVGDEITIDYDGERFIYQIDKIFAVKPDAVEIENRTDQPQLTLYSCTLGGASDGREVIVATPKHKQ